MDYEIERVIANEQNLHKMLEEDIDKVRVDGETKRIVKHIMNKRRKELEELRDM